MRDRAGNLGIHLYLTISHRPGMSNLGCGFLSLYISLYISLDDVVPLSKSI